MCVKSLYETQPEALRAAFNAAGGRDRVLAALEGHPDNDYVMEKAMRCVGLLCSLDDKEGRAMAKRGAQLISQMLVMLARYVTCCSVKSSRLILNPPKLCWCTAWHALYGTGTSTGASVQSLHTSF